jgi:hypothetical protein
MQTVYIGNTLINDIFLGSQRMDDVFENALVSFQAEFLVVASGARGGTGGGSPSRTGGGGGAGGLLSGSLTIIPNTTYQIQVGGWNANNVFYDSYLTGSNFYHYSYAGGRGGQGNGTDASKNGQNGGSGGGAARNSNGVGSFGTGISGQGNNGSTEANSTTGGGGGGAAAAGSGATGGAGKASSISGTSTTYSKGGDAGGGAAGTNYGDGSNSSGTSSTGEPKEGVVILRYLAPQKLSGGTVTTDGNYIVQTFYNTTSGTIDPAINQYTITYN